MRKVLTALITIPLGLLFIVFAVANRHVITVSFDPFNTADPAIGVTLPLFVVIIASAILGVIAGSVATWFGQGHWRRSARRHQAESARIRRELDEMRRRPPMAPVPQQAGLPAPLLGYDAAARDKPRLTM
jgi:uncharacterized integral membrane protein